MEESLAAEGNDENGEPMVTHTAARHSVQLLQCYFVEQGFDDNGHASLNACTDLIYSMKTYKVYLIQPPMCTSWCG